MFLPLAQYPSDHRHVQPSMYPWFPKTQAHQRKVVFPSTVPRKLWSYQRCEVEVGEQEAFAVGMLVLTRRHAHHQGSLLRNEVFDPHGWMVGYYLLTKQRVEMELGSKI